MFKVVYTNLLMKFIDYISLQVLSWSSSVSMALLIWVRKSSRPRSSIVSTHPLSARHEGHVLTSWSGPLYQLLTQLSHPRMVLQHLLMMTAGLMGTRWHIVHLNVSRRMRFSATGIRLFSLSENMSARVSLIFPISAISISSYSSFLSLLLLGWKSSSSESMKIGRLKLEEGLQSLSLWSTA